MTTRFLRSTLLPALPLLFAIACGSGDSQPAAEGGAAGSRRGGPPGAAGAGFPGGGEQQSPAVPVEAIAVARRGISSFIQTNGILEADNEVDIVARTSGPILALEAEEGMTVRRGQLLARIDDRDVRSNVEIARVALEEAKLTFERAKKLLESRLISAEEYEQASTRFETAKAQYENNRILLAYTQIEAPFAGQIVTRYVDLAQQVTSGTPLFRISDFDPLLCPIQVPERELRRLEVGQGAYLTVEAWPGEQFPAKVLRVSPVIDAATGTVKVTLDLAPDKGLRPGMFARVFLETERHENALVIPKAALSLESLGDTVYVVSGDTAERREVTLGFREQDSVEVLDGLDEGEMVVVVGQDGLSDGTPIQVLDDPNGKRPAEDSRASQGRDASPEYAQSDGGDPPGRRPEGRMDPSLMTPEQLERAKESMRERGLTEEEIEARLEQRRQQGQGQ